MTSPFVRLIVALALAVAVPVQAMSAVMAGICMAAGHHDAGHDQHDHHGDDEAAAGHSHDTGSTESSNAHCPPCVACCAAGSISSAAQTFVPERPAAGPFAAVVDSPAGFQPDRLDRPPLAL